jgi:hypothetical protein
MQDTVEPIQFWRMKHGLDATTICCSSNRSILGDCSSPRLGLCRFDPEQWPTVNSKSSFHKENRSEIHQKLSSTTRAVHPFSLRWIFEFSRSTTVQMESLSTIEKVR